MQFKDKAVKDVETVCYFGKKEQERLTETRVQLYKGKRKLPIPSHQMKSRSYKY